MPKNGLMEGEPVQAGYGNRGLRTPSGPPTDPFWTPSGPPPDPLRTPPDPLRTPYRASPRAPA
eukprot:564285-Prorocentrum_minimum.AAC.1